MTKILNFGLKIKGGSKEGGTCEVLRPCHPPQKKLKHAPMKEDITKRIDDLNEDLKVRQESIESSEGQTKEPDY